MKQINMKLASEYADKAARSLFYFDKEVLGYKDMEEDTHLQLCEFVNDRYTETEDGRGKPFKLILMPRGSFKTSIVTIGFTIQLLILNPNIRVLIANERFDNAKGFLLELKGHLENNELFRGMYGDLVGKKTWTSEEITVSTRTKNLKEPSVSTAGIGVVKVGMHYDIIIMDDLVSQENITTRDQMNKVVNFYRLALSLLNPGGRIIVIGTRWHFNDLYNFLLEEEKHRFDYFIRSAYNPDKTLFFPQILSKEFLDNQRKSQLGYIFACNPAEAPILMSDMSFKKIEDVSVGDSVVGWIKNGTKNRKLSPSKVLETNNRIADIVKIKLKSGRVVRCTPDHKWYTQRFEHNRYEYAPAAVGHKLLFFADPFKKNLSGEEKRLSAWLGGMFDGEGGCSRDSSAIYIHQSRKNNPEVCEAIESTFAKLGYDYGVSYRKSKDTHAYYIRGGLQERIRFVNECMPVKKFNIIRTMFVRGRKFVKERDEIISITPDGREKVYALTTETGNYIVWGYCSKNCQYLNNPVDDETATFKKEWIHYYRMTNKMLIPIEEEMTDETGKVKIIPHFSMDDCNIYLTVDPAISQLKCGDFTGMIVGAVDPEDRKFILHAKRYKIQPKELIDEIFRLWKRYNAMKVGIETNVFQKVLRFWLVEEMKRRKQYLPIVEINTSNTATKIMKISGLQPLFKFGTIYLLKEMVDLEDELLRFPVGQHDDILDALAQQMDLWSKPALNEHSEAPVGSFDWIRNKIINRNKYADYIGNENIDKWRAANEAWY